jgi:membrane-associated phospholipid phosphatase
MKQNDFYWLGGTVAITLILIQYDQSIDAKFYPVKENNSFIRDVGPHFTELGDYYGYIFLAGYGAYSIVFHNYRAFRTALLASQAVIATGLWTSVGKVLTGRMRPGETYSDPEYNSDHWFGPFGRFKEKYNSQRGVGGFESFPSGHTGAIFAMATVFSEQYKDQKAIPITMYSIAGLVGISRMIEHKHWASDVFIGGVIGYLCGKQVVNNERRLFPKYKLASRKHSTFLYPYSSAESTGMVWKLVF